MTAALHTVHVRVNDSATGQPTPVRIRFTRGNGEYFAPFGRLAVFPTGQGEDVGGNLEYQGSRFAYIDGTCEIRLPACPITVQISKGPEYLPLRRELSLGPGKLALRFALERWINLREQGWYSGDTRAHFLSPHAALLQGAAEDLAVVNLLAGQFELPSKKDGREYATIPNILAFSGQRPVLEVPGHMVVVNTYNQHPVLGNVGLLNCHRPIYPLRFGGTEGPDNWTLADWCDQCHRKGGLVVWCDCCIAPADSVNAHRESEALADLILGKIDALEIDDLVDWSGITGKAYLLWNSGLKVALAGCSGKDDNLRNLGFVRTYAHLPPRTTLTYPNWIEAVRDGRSFVTNGPLLSFTVNRQEPGAVVRSSTPSVHVRAEAHSVLPFDRLDIVANGEVVAGADATGSPASAVLDADLALPDGGWLAARCSGPQWWEGRICAGHVAAHTSPVYVQVEDRPARSDREAVRYLNGLLNSSLDWVRTRGRFENDKQRQDFVDIFEAARRELAKGTADRR